LRGHSSLHAALDCAIEVTGTEASRNWSIHKSKDDVTGDAHPFKLQIVSVGSDDEGNEVSSRVAVMDTDKRRTKVKAFAWLEPADCLGGIGWAFSQLDPLWQDKAAGSRPCIKYDAAVDLVAQRMTTDRNHQKSSAKTAITGLVNKKFLGMEGAWLWDALYTPPAPVPFPDSPFLRGHSGKPGKPGMTKSVGVSQTFKPLQAP
jgi:hypothetical protein